MSMIDYFHSPTIINWNLDNQGNPVSVTIENETKQVVNGKIPLDGIPDEQYRVFIDNMFEIDIRDKIDSPEKFKCDYTHGVLYFSQELNGQSININKYYSKGHFFIPASRVWVKLSVDGEVIQTMDGAFDILDEQSNDISALQNVRIHEGADKPNDTKFWYDEDDTSVITRG